MADVKKILGGLALGMFIMTLPCYASAQVTLEPSHIQLNNLTLDQLQQAAQAGDPDAQYALGYMYYYGKGVPQDTHAALDWIKRASVQDQKQAVNAMSLLGSPAPSVPAAVPLPSSTSAAANEVTAVSAESDKQQTEPTEKTAKPVVANAYTIQLLSSSSKKSAEKYIKSNHLSGNARIYSSKKKSKTIYIVGYGSYSSTGEAKAMIKKLPASIRAKKPFVKSTGSFAS